MPGQEELGMEELDNVTGGSKNAKEIIETIKTKAKNLSTKKKIGIITAFITALGLTVEETATGGYLIKGTKNILTKRKMNKDSGEYNFDLGEDLAEESKNKHVDYVFDLDEDLEKNGFAGTDC